MKAKDESGAEKTVGVVSWAKMLFVAILVLGLASVPHVAVGAFRMRRFHLVA